MTVYALTGGTAIVAGVLVVTIVAVIYGTFTYRGSGITPHAGDQTGDAPGAADPATPPAKGAPTTAARSPPTAPNSR